MIEVTLYVLMAWHSPPLMGFRVPGRRLDCQAAQAGREPGRIPSGIWKSDTQGKSG